MSKIHTYDPRFSILKKLQKNGKNASTMQQDNRNLILQLIRESGSISRKQLAEISGLQQATVTIIMQEFLSQGLIQESGMIDGGNGRRVKSFAMSEEFYVVSARLTGAYLNIALFNLNIQPLYVKKIFLKTSDYTEETIALMQKHLKEIENIVEKNKILCVIMGVEHMYRLVDNDYAVWDEVRQEYCPIGKRLHDITGYKVFVNRAINFSSYDAWDRYKEVKKKENDYAMLIVVQMSYDLESAIIVNHEIMYGKEGMCGQLRDLRIDRNSSRTYKDVLTVPALLKRADELLDKYPDSCIAGIEELNIRDVIKGYQKKDRLCRQVYEEVICHLGYVLSLILNWLDPDEIMVGDEIPMTEEFLSALREEVAKYYGEEKAQRIDILWGERVTKNDPVLIGGAKYGFDLVIGDIGIYEGTAVLN